ncbi:hypothetical protein CKM354_000766400 [Cercospora kikuchii]|uniref:non-specific serine/threonine protein kinase n=1 Tax=Cercospora kikuchii TaxID=84275 RepID=A0A9P3CN65_9PEZI|nr:uncharacterized protein CKM354_000766400 [Cercospora kikuchii]GIZ44467.1 hypothetical protein CKM354_000766400 [Cercospora kikuchii]
MEEEHAWVELHVEAWESEKTGNGQSITDVGRNTVRRNAQHIWRRRVSPAERHVFAAEAQQRLSLIAKIAPLAGLPPEPDTDDLAALSPWFRRAWDLLVARRALRLPIRALIRRIPGDSVGSLRTRNFLQESADDNENLAREGIDALDIRLGRLPACRPSRYIDMLEADSPDPADDEGRRIPNYLQRRREAFIRLNEQMPAFRRAIEGVEKRQSKATGTLAGRYVPYLREEIAEARSVMKNLTELIDGLTAWSGADAVALAREEATSDATPDVANRVAYQHHLLQWEECAAAYRYAENALSDLIVLRAARGDTLTVDLEGHMETLHRSVARRLADLEIQVRFKQSVLHERYSSRADEAALLQSLPVLPWSRVQNMVGEGASGQVEAWIKTDHNDNVVDRVARKEAQNLTPNGHALYDIWRPADRHMPVEVAAMYRLRALKDSMKSVIQIRNWRPVGDGKTSIIYMNLCQHGDLAQVRDQYVNLPGRQMPPEAFVWSVLESLADSGLLMERGEVADVPPGLHNWTQIVHGDMKAANVLLDDNKTGLFTGFPRAILADFGLAIIHPIKTLHGAAGTFIPGSPSNVRGIGMIARTLIEAVWEFLEDDDPGWTAVTQTTYSNELINLIHRCLSRDLDDRPTLLEIKKAATTKSGDLRHDAAIDMRNAKADDPRWAALKVLTTNTKVPVALARDADGDVEMVGGPTGQPIRSRLPPRSGHDPDDDAGGDEEGDPDEQHPGEDPDDDALEDDADGNLDDDLDDDLDEDSDEDIDNDIEDDAEQGLDKDPDIELDDDIDNDLDGGSEDGSGDSDENSDDMIDVRSRALRP